MRDAFDPPEFSTEVTRDPAGPLTRVSVTGEVDLATSGDLGRLVRAELPHAPVLLDLSEVTFMDSTGVRMLDALLAECARQRWALRVGATMGPSVRQVLDLTGMLGVLPLAGDDGRPVR